MSKFRTASQGNKTTNRAGGDALKQSPELELVSLLLTSFVQDKFYESADEQLNRLSNIVTSIKDKEFAGKAAVYARNEFGMRSITHALIGEITNKVKGEEWTRKAVTKTMHRPDDMLETLAYYLNTYGKPIPNSLKKGLRDALNNFDDYQISKYKGAKSSVKMVDLLNLVHPSPNSELSKTFKKLVSNELISKNTWEKGLTQAGQKAKDIEDEEEREEKVKEEKAKVWVDLIKERKLGYFALLKNLRNILQQAPEVLDEALEMLTDENLIKKSLVMPFRYQTAMEAIEGMDEEGIRKTVVALQKALDISVSNVPKFPGKTLVAVDTSGSMMGTWSDKTPIKIAALFGSVLYKSNDADLLLFDTEAQYLAANPLDSTLTISEKIIRNANGGGTNFHLIFDEANKAYDRIVILSDMQAWVGSGYYSNRPAESEKRYKERTGANPHIYSFDLQGYGDMQFPEDRVYAIAGWSDKVFDIMQLLEEDRNALVNKIKSVEL